MNEAMERWIRWCLWCPEADVRAKAYSALTHGIALNSGKELTNRFIAHARFDELVKELRGYFGVAESHVF